MTTLSQEQEQPIIVQSQQRLQRQRSSEQEPLNQPNHHPPPVQILPVRVAPRRQPSHLQQRPPPHPASSSTIVGHRHHQHPQHSHHHHHSHPRLSQKNRQKLFSRSRGYTSVCSGSGSQHGCASRSRCSKDHDEDIEVCPYHPWPEEPASVISERCTRARINSAIFVSSEGKGFDSIEFIRRYGSQSVLCRKARSAENVSASERQRRFSEYPEWESEESKQNCKVNDSSNYDSTNPHQDSIELVECHNEPSPTTNIVSTSNPKTSSSSSGATANSRPTPKLSTLPTLSVSGPSPPHEEEFL